MAWKKKCDAHSSLITKTALFSCGSAILGDLICQYMMMSQSDDENASFAEEVELERLKRMGIIGASINGPLTYGIVQFLERTFSSSTDLSTVLKKTGANACFSPVYIFLSFVMSEYLKPESSLESIKTKLERDFMKTVAAGLCFWPLVSVLNNKFVPAKYRAMMSAFVGIFWNIIMSRMANTANNAQNCSADSSMRANKHHLQLQHLQGNVTAAGQQVAFGSIHDKNPNNHKDCHSPKTKGSVECQDFSTMMVGGASTGQGDSTIPSSLFVLTESSFSSACLDSDIQLCVDVDLLCEIP